jgi:hypothetical protein
VADPRGDASSWFFDTGPEGRFNLTDAGTCYLDEGAGRRLRREVRTPLRPGGVIPEPLVDTQRLSRLRPPKVIVVDLTQSQGPRPRRSHRRDPRHDRLRLDPELGDRPARRGLRRHPPHGSPQPAGRAGLHRLLRLGQATAECREDGGHPGRPDSRSSRHLRDHRPPPPPLATPIGQHDLGPAAVASDRRHSCRAVTPKPLQHGKPRAYGPHTGTAATTSCYRAVAPKNEKSPVKPGFLAC